MNNWRSPGKELGLALIAGIGLIGGSFILAQFTQYNDSLFSLVPSVQDGVDIPNMDIISKDKIYIFHATIYTIWATMLLSLPAFCLVWFIRKSQIAARYWLTFWTIGLIAMFVHLFMAMGLLFEWNWQHILKETIRVTIPIPDLVLTLWWTIDVSLGWFLLHSRGVLLHGQRIILHVALLTVFLIGFIREGEIIFSKVLGITSALLVVAALLFGLMRLRQNAIQ